jgi:hypothetical protein
VAEGRSSTNFQRSKSRDGGIKLPLLNFSIDYTTNDSSTFKRRISSGIPGTGNFEHLDDIAASFQSTSSRPDSMAGPGALANAAPSNQNDREGRGKQFHFKHGDSGVMGAIPASTRASRKNDKRKEKRKEERQAKAKAQAAQQSSQPPQTQ